MQFDFFKYHGTGNDFIIADNRDKSFPYGNNLLVKKLCDRNFGVGADGLMLLENNPGFDFHMRYFNSNGLEGSMCGNGGRCIVHFAKEAGIIEKTAIFSGSDGSHEAVIENEKTVSIRLQDVNGVERDGKAYIVDTGSPHYVLFAGNIDQIDVVDAGRKIRYANKYGEKGINVNFAETAGDTVRIRTYERGVENETLACGTGSVAAALCALVEMGNGKNPVKIETRGGQLEVRFKQTGTTTFTDIWLTGPAIKVFRGITDIDEIMNHHNRV